MNDKQLFILLTSQKITELKLKLKLLKWNFENANLTPTEINAILDDYNRTRKTIEMLEKRLEKLI